jgi:hypothetical protein
MRLTYPPSIIIDVSYVEASFLIGNSKCEPTIYCLYDPLYKSFDAVGYFFLKLNKIDPSSLRNYFCLQ